MSWPVLSRRPKSETVMTVQNVIKHQTESGVILRRRKVTAEKKKFRVAYDLLSAADAGLVKDHFNLVNLHSSFDWTDKTGVTRSVFFEKEISYIEHVNGWFAFEPFEFTES